MVASGCLARKRSSLPLPGVAHVFLAGDPFDTRLELRRLANACAATGQASRTRPLSPHSPNNDPVYRLSTVWTAPAGALA